MQCDLNLRFSISATSRPPRGTEQDGVEYFFLSLDEFKRKIENDEFVEYEEVYENRFYGTLKSQVEKQLSRGENVVFDVDVHGGMDIKALYGERALSIFIQPPSIEDLRNRLEQRGTDAPERSRRGSPCFSCSGDRARGLPTRPLRPFSAEPRKARFRCGRT